MPLVSAYFRLLRVLGAAASLALLLYAEDVLSAEAYAPIDLLVNAACLTLPYLADAVDSAADIIGALRRLIRWMVTGRPLP